MKKVAVLGATGLIGQQFIRLLINHPQFELTSVFASSSSAGTSLENRWSLPFFDAPAELNQYTLEDVDTIRSRDDIDIVFSALPGAIANELEADLRDKGLAVFSNTSSHRMDPDVPILIPEVNYPHLDLVDVQKEKYNGFIVTNANCSVTGASMYLHELRRQFPLDKVVVSTYQALSGAGLRGVTSLQSTDNVIPFIKNEEHKICIESKKILGEMDGEHILPYEYNIVANALRVPVIDGHTEAISCFVNEADQDQLNEFFMNIRSPLTDLDLYTAPNKHIAFFSDEDRPQPRRDRFLGETEQRRGMVTSVGRLRVDAISVSAVVLVHNTIRGGSGGSVLNAELALKKGKI